MKVLVCVLTGLFLKIQIHISPQYTVSGPCFFRLLYLGDHSISVNEAINCISAEYYSTLRMKLSQGRHGSVGWALPHKAKCHWFHSRSGHIPGLQVRSPIGACSRGNWSLPFSLPSPLSKKNNKYVHIFKKNETVYIASPLPMNLMNLQGCGFFKFIFIFICFMQLNLSI